MNTYTEVEVVLMPLTLREEDNRSRSRKGFQVYLSRFFWDFKSLSVDDQRRELEGDEGVPDNDNVLSIDSIDSPEVINHVEVMRMACKRWRGLEPIMVAAWKQRAENLNRRPVPGRFYNIPVPVTHNLKENVLQEMTLDWEKLVSVLKNTITRPPKEEISRRALYFGKERVTMWSQSYHAMFINLLVRQTLFGVSYRKMNGAKEVVYKTKQITELHIASLGRMEKLFTISGLCGVKFTRQMDIVSHVAGRSICFGMVGI